MQKSMLGYVATGVVYCRFWHEPFVIYKQMSHEIDIRSEDVRCDTLYTKNVEWQHCAKKDSPRHIRQLENFRRCRKWCGVILPCPEGRNQNPNVHFYLKPPIIPQPLWPTTLIAHRHYKHIKLNRYTRWSDCDAGPTRTEHFGSKAPQRR